MRAAGFLELRLPTHPTTSVAVGRNRDVDAEPVDGEAFGPTRLESVAKAPLPLYSGGEGRRDRLCRREQARHYILARTQTIDGRGSRLSILENGAGQPLYDGFAALRPKTMKILCQGKASTTAADNIQANCHCAARVKTPKEIRQLRLEMFVELKRAWRLAL